MITAIDSRTIVFNIDPSGTCTAKRQELNLTANERRLLLFNSINLQENGGIRLLFVVSKIAYMYNWTLAAKQTHFSFALCE